MTRVRATSFAKARAKARVVAMTWAMVNATAMAISMPGVTAAVGPGKTRRLRPE
jgi:hypothetical protein